MIFTDTKLINLAIEILIWTLIFFGTVMIANSKEKIHPLEINYYLSIEYFSILMILCCVVLWMKRCFQLFLK